jgi:cytochrome b561
VTSGLRSPELLEGLIGGLLCGAALAYLGLRHTRFEVTTEGRFYTPHTYIGLAVMLLFLGRLAYRFLYLSIGTGGTFAADPSAAAAYQRSPLTLGVFGVLVGYYVLYYAGILLRTRASAPPAPDAASSKE